MDSIGIRCKKCNTDVWCSSLQGATKNCKCGNTNITLDGIYPVIGAKKGNPYQILSKKTDGSIEVTDSMDTSRAPEAAMDERLANRRNSSVPE